MKIMTKLAVLAVTALLLFLTDIPQQPLKLPITVQLVPDAEAILGVRRRTRRRAVAIGYAAGVSAGSAQAAQTSSAASAQAAAAPAPESAPAGNPPLGTTVATLPDGCASTTKDGVQYFNCGGVYYRAAFQGNQLVYVVAQP